MKKILLYFFVITLPFQTRFFLKYGEINNGYSEYQTISLYLSDIFLITLIIFFIFNFFRNSQKTFKILNQNIIFALTGLEFIIFLSCFFADKQMIAFYFYFKFLLSLSLFFLLLNIEISKQKIINILSYSSFFIALFSIWQWFSRSSPALSYLGLASHNLDKGQSVIENLEGERFLRAYGIFDHPNIYGGFLSIITIFLIIAIYQSKNKKEKIFFYVTIFVNQIALFFSFSRSAWLSLFSGIFSILLISFWKKDLSLQKHLAKTTIILMFPLLILSYYYYDLISIRLNNNSRLENISTEERIDYLKTSTQIIKENFFIGVGAGNYTNYLSEKIKNKESYFYQPVHNVFFLIWAELGIFGLTLFLMFYLYFLILTIKINLINSSILIAMLVLMFFDHWLWSLHFGIIFFYFCLSLTSLDYKLILDKKKS